MVEPRQLEHHAKLQVGLELHVPSRKWHLECHLSIYAPRQVGMAFQQREHHVGPATEAGAPHRAGSSPYRAQKGSRRHVSRALEISAVLVSGVNVRLKHRSRLDDSV